MKRNAKQNGSGGRLRLGLLMATVAAFLLVPAAQAFAVEDAHITITGSGSGRVYGVTPTPGNLPIECHKPSQVGDVCNTEHQVAGPYSAISVSKEASPGSEFVGWTVEEGSVISGCTTGTCSVKLGPEIKIKAEFALEPDVHIITEGKGSGKVVGDTALNGGSPQIECEWNGVTETQSGVCDAVHGTLTGKEGVKVLYALEGGSAFGGWTVESGFGIVCPPFGAFCGVWLEGEPEIRIRAVFTPPPVPLTINTGGGTGSGQVNCKVNGGSTDSPCGTEYPEGTELELISAPDTGSELGSVSGTGSASGCTTLPCTITELNVASEVNAPFNLEKFSLTLNPPIGEGTLEALCEGGPCPAEIPYGTEVTVTATPDSLNSVGSFTNGGSANCSIAGVGPEEPATCEFEIKANSEVTVEFVSAGTIDTQEEYVHGNVPLTTELGTSCGNDVNLGEFVPYGAAYTRSRTCALTVTSTGQETSLTAADLSGEERGKLTQLVVPPNYYDYTLANPLKVKIENTGGYGNPTLVAESLESLDAPFVTLMEFPEPVSVDAATLEFSQLINAHEPLHTGVYAKTITLTLAQTEV